MMRSGFWGTDFKAIDYDKIADLTVTVNPIENIFGPDAFNLVIFDSGSLNITNIDLTGNTISGQISANTNEGTSTLLGKFTIPINPI